MPVLRDQRLLIVTGKGGVGKSTVAAALALLSARAGRRTLVCEVNAKERITTLLGRSEVGPEIGMLEENLWAVNVQPQEALREYALMILKFESIYNAVFENRLIRYFLRFIPSMQELVILGKILFHVQERRDDGSPRFDRVIIDAPATGHAISFLSIPNVLLQTVPPGPLSKEAERMRDLLVNPTVTGAVLVSLPEEMPVNETIELERALRDRVGVAAAAVVLNGFIEERFDEADLSALVGTPPLHSAARMHADRALLSSVSRERLEKAIAAKVHPVPRLFLQQFSRDAIEEVARCLAPLVGAAP